MRITKIIEIEVCDICHEEKGHWPSLCSSCGKDVCDQCMESFHVTIRHFSKMQRSKDGYKSYTVDTNQCDYTTMYCKECSAGITDVLGRVGFKNETKKANP